MSHDCWRRSFTWGSVYPKDFYPRAVLFTARLLRSIHDKHDGFHRVSKLGFIEFHELVFTQFQNVFIEFHELVFIEGQHQQGQRKGQRQGQSYLHEYRRFAQFGLVDVWARRSLNIGAEI